MCLLFTFPSLSLGQLSPREVELPGHRPGGDSGTDKPLARLQTHASLRSHRTALLARLDPPDPFPALARLLPFHRHGCPPTKPPFLGESSQWPRFRAQRGPQLPGGALL